MSKSKPKTVDVSMLSNDDLRPWTMDLVLEERLVIEVDSLEKTISYTSPHKIAGTRGSSVLDGRQPELLEHVRTIKNLMPSDSYVETARSNTNSRSSDRNNLPALPSNHQLVLDGSGSRPLSTASRQSSAHSQHGDPTEESDAEHIRQLQTSMLRQSQQQRTQRLNTSPLKAIRYEQNKAPAVLNVGNADYQRLKQLSQSSPTKQ